MPQLIKSVEGEVIDVTNGDVNYVTSVIGELQEEDYINLNGFIAYLQNLTRAEEVDVLIKPLSFGLKNKYNIPVITLEISY